MEQGYRLVRHGDELRRETVLNDMANFSLLRKNKPVPPLFLGVDKRGPLRLYTT